MEDIKNIPLEAHFTFIYFLLGQINIFLLIIIGHSYITYGVQSEVNSVGHVGGQRCEGFCYLHTSELRKASHHSLRMAIAEVLNRCIHANSAKSEPQIGYIGLIKVVRVQCSHQSNRL